MKKIKTYSILFAVGMMLLFTVLQAKATEINQPTQNEERPERPPWWPPRPSGLFLNLIKQDI